jgi:hypothetical protein
VLGQIRKLSQPSPLACEFFFIHAVDRVVTGPSRWQTRSAGQTHDLNASAWPHSGGAPKPSDCRPPPREHSRAWLERLANSGPGIEELSDEGLGFWVMAIDDPVFSDPQS